MTFEELLVMQAELMTKVPHEVRPELERVRTAGLGLIEEVIEYLNSLGHKPWRNKPLPMKNQLEELTDPLFFYLELILLSEFSWDDITSEYKRKHAVNLERYRRAAQGDTGWDDRATKGEL